MIDILQHPAVKPVDPADVQIECALPDCHNTFLYGDGYKLSGGWLMRGDRSEAGHAPTCQHVCCCEEHALQALVICLRDHAQRPVRATPTAQPAPTARAVAPTRKRGGT